VQIERDMADTSTTINVTVHDKTADEAWPSDGLIASLWFSPDTVPVLDQHGEPDGNTDRRRTPTRRPRRSARENRSAGAH
jgi:hypothetical protein